MSEELAAARPSAPAPYGETQLEAWQETRFGAPPSARSPIERPLAAIRRYKWLALAVVALSTLGGVAATNFLSPTYEVQARIMITTGNQAEDRIGPIRSAGLLEADDWAQLFRSSAVADPVVRKLSLYLTPSNASDAHLFAGFSLADGGYRAGKYELVINSDRKRWTIRLATSGVPVDSGGSADSLARVLGFKWLLPPSVFNGSGARSVGFTVSTPRETAQKLVSRLNPQRPPGSNFLRLTLEDPNPTLAAEILNTWVSEFVNVAATLKRRKLSEFARTLEGQLQTGKATLDAAETELQTFRVQTIIKPGEGTPVASGLEQTRDPVFRAFFNKSVEYDEIKRDVQLLRSLIAGVAMDSVPSEALLQINSVATNTPATASLRTAVTDYNTKQSELANALIPFTDEHPTVKTLRQQITLLKKERIPLYANELLATLRARETEDSIRLAAMQINLQQIPPRTIEEERLRRKRDAAAGLFTNLQSRHAEAQLAEASATPDISVLDTAIAPLQPTKNTKPRLILMAVLGGIAAGLGLAILLDMLDGRFRYPEQATDELGLPLAGTVPRFPRGGVNRNSAEQTFQLVESFRSLRMTVLQASRDQTVSIAISSPSPGDGKSLISANLAMSFADAGLRTVLVDGDTRRGTLNEMFGLRTAPGLTDYLAGSAGLEQVLYPTSHPSLSVVPAGVRRRRSPELLTSPRLGELVDALRGRHDVVIFDTPPFAAGVDGYSIASATGSLLVVLRVGKTGRRLAAEKLRVLDRLPVEIVGAVLNGIQLSGAYSYYGYVPGYEAADESEETGVVKMS